MTKQFTASEVREVVSHMDDVAMTDAEEILLAFASRLEADEKAEAVGDADDCVRGIRLKFQSGNDVPVERAWITRSEWDAVERLLATHPSPTQPPSVDQARIQAGENALKVLANIRDAKRWDRKCFEDDRAFADWAQSWARHATQVEGAQPCSR